MELNRVKDDSSTKTSMQLLEEALTLCKFGKFHIRLLAATFFSSITATMVNITSSFILPIAECDLNMSIIDKGLLNAMPFFGQIGACFFAGFIIDSFGRKRCLVGGTASIFILMIIEGSSQKYWMLLVTKCLEGISISLCYSAVSTHVAELCHIGVRDKILVMCSTFGASAQIISSLIAWAILPLKINFTIWEGYFEIHSWNIFIYVTSIWGLIAFILYLTIPESPKFLLSHAKEKEALEVLKSIYKENCGNKQKNFPIVSLNSSGTINPSSNVCLKKQIVNGLFQTKELFRRPLVLHLILFCFINFAAFAICTPLRIWFPQVSTMIENYDVNQAESSRFCVMINSYMQNLKSDSSNATESEVCTPILSGQKTYINGVIMGFTALVLVGISGLLVDYVGQRLLMLVSLILSAACSAALYWTNTSLQIAVLISVTASLLLTTICLVFNILVRFFPTTLRGLAVSIILMIGRLGSLAGSILFPIALKMGCMVPFIATTIVSLVIAGLVYLLPNVTEDNKKTGDK